MEGEDATVMVSNGGRPAGKQGERYSSRFQYRVGCTGAAPAPPDLDEYLDFV